jgi:hypothetical protein
MPDNSNRRRRGPGAGQRRRDADPHTLVGAYAMDAVSDDERAAFEQHLAGCETCQAEVRGLREATARLAVAAEVRPRAELREQTVAAADLIRQLPPVPADDQPGEAPRRRIARHAAAATLAGGRGRGGAVRRGWLPRLALGAAAALAVVAVWLGVAMHGAEHRLTVMQGSSHEIADVLGASDATMMTDQVSTGGSATVVMSHHSRALVFTAADLRSLPHARRYELWLMGPAGPRPVGMLPAPRNGMTGPMVVSGLERGDKVGLTVERAGGAHRPTAPAILMLRLDS